MDKFVNRLNALHKAVNDKRDSVFKKLTKHKKVLAYSIQHKRDDADENRKIKRLMKESICTMNVAVCRGSLICDTILCVADPQKILDTNILEVMDSLNIKDTDFAPKYDLFHKNLLSFLAENINIRRANDINIICLILCLRKDISSINLMMKYKDSYLFELLPKHRLHLFMHRDIVTSFLANCVDQSLDNDWLSDLDVQQVKNVCVIESRPYELYNLVTYIDNCLLREKQEHVTLNGKTLSNEVLAEIHNRNVKAMSCDMIIENIMLCITSELKIY